MSYTRVIPRDLFNEAKLLKCLGQLSLLIHNGVRWPLSLELDDHRVYGCDGDWGVENSFVIDQNSTNGGLFCDNLELYCGSRIIHVYTSCNSKSPYPLLFYKGWEDGGEDEVFTDDGQFSEAFCQYLDFLTKEGA